MSTMKIDHLLPLISLLHIWKDSPIVTKMCPSPQRPAPQPAAARGEAQRGGGGSGLNALPGGLGQGELVVQEKISRELKSESNEHSITKWNRSRENR